MTTVTKGAGFRTCPVCGSERICIKNQSDKYQIYCGRCDSATDEYSTISEAEDAWENQRVNWNMTTNTAPADDFLIKTEKSPYIDFLYDTTDEIRTNPSYYHNDSFDTIDVIEAFTKDLSGDIAFATGNAIKYLCRWPNKNGLEDLKKAKWYIDYIIKKSE